MSTPKSRYFICFVIAVFSFLFGWQGSNLYISNFGPRVNITGSSPSPTAAFTPILESLASKGIDLSMFWEIWQTLDQRYLHTDGINEKNMIYGSIKGMVSSLNDPYTVYLTPEETKEFKDSLDGSLEGIGAELTVRDFNLTIVSPLKNSPAELAGLLPGDIIYKINGEIASEMTLYEAVGNIRGEIGTEVILTIIREKVEQPFDVKIVRQHIDIESVSLEDKGNSISLLSVNQFSDDTRKEFSEKVSDILLHEPKGLILDLRFNGGGYLDIAVDILSELIAEKSEVVTIKKKQDSDTEKIFVSGGGRIANIPMVILVNNGSASASEIVAGAVQDHRRGIIIGEQTFGKGTVQEVETFNDGSSLRLTVAEWYTPGGRSIDKVGITPDIVVAMTEDDYNSGNDNQMEKAIEYLKGL